MNPNTEHTEVYPQDGSDLPPGADLEPIRVPELEIARRAHDLSVMRKKAILARGAADTAIAEAGRLRSEYQELVMTSRQAFDAEGWGEIESKLMALDPIEPSSPPF